MKIYGVQLDIVWENKPANYERVKALLQAAAPEPGSMVLLPEMFATGFSMNVKAIREKAGGKTEKFVSRLARDFQVYVTAGVVQATSDRGYNQSVTFSPAGAEIARYSKLQTFTLGGESANYEAGRAVATWKWNGLSVSPFVCYDLRFPEHFRTAARAGAEVMTVIANWPVARIQHWVTLLQARAIENQCFVAGVNRCGTDPKLTYNGRSLLVNPKGEILADAGNGECVIHAELDVKLLRSYRKDFPFLKDMKPVTACEW
jgi:predicted amidohydrolase